MKINFIKIILLSVFILSFILPITSFGADYVPLAPLPGTTVGTCSQPDPNDPNCKADLTTYLPGIFKLLIGIAGALAALVMVIGGVQYLSTDAISGKEEGKEKLTNALVGLLLAIASWLILNTINPNTLSFDLKLARVPAPLVGSPTQDNDNDGISDFADQCPNTPRGDPVNAQGCPLSASVLCPGKVQNTQVPCSCPDTICTVIGPSGQVPYNSIPLKAGQGDRVVTNLANLLNGLNATLSSAGISWQVTEAWKPTVSHQNDCHRLGTCVDANISNPTAANINGFIGRASMVGLTAVYEVSTAAAKQQLVNAGVPSSNCRNNSPGVCVVTAITAPHFSVYCAACTRTGP